MLVGLDSYPLILLSTHREVLCINWAKQQKGNGLRKKRSREEKMEKRSKYVTAGISGIRDEPLYSNNRRSNTDDDIGAAAAELPTIFVVGEMEVVSAIRLIP